MINNKNKKILLIFFSIVILAFYFGVIKKNYDNNSINIAFYSGKEKIDIMPSKDNSENLFFSRGECDNGAYVEWNNEEWSPLIKNLSKSKTKCSLYFGKPIELGKDILTVESGDGLYSVSHDVSKISTDWNNTEYRYAGLNPNNYVKFNNEKWRIIGLVNVKTTSGIEQRIKIIRTAEIENQKNVGFYAWDRPSGYNNNWTTSKLKDMLNGIYYNSGIGDCYQGDAISNSAILATCDFSGNNELSNGLEETARNMIDKEVIWNLGGISTNEDVNVAMFYEGERGTATSNTNFPPEWSLANDSEYFNGIGLLYPSDYGYATNGGTLGRDACFEKAIYYWRSTDEIYRSQCSGTDWLKPSSNTNLVWTITHNSSSQFSAFYLNHLGFISNTSVTRDAHAILPVIYLKSSVKILENTQFDKDYGTIDNPFILSVQ